MKYLLLMAMMFIGTASASENTYTPALPIEQVSKSLSSVERDVRNAAVKVITPRGGHGSGSLIKYKDIILVITAKHVAEHDIGTTYKIFKDDESVPAVLMYKSNIADISVLVLGGTFRNKDIKAMDWNVTKSYDVGMDIVYSGYPSWHKLMSFNGRVAGYEKLSSGETQLIVNTYGWFGCSGSALYDTKGKIIGVLYGVDVEYVNGTQVQENMIWVAPIKQIDIKEAVEPFCRGTVGKYKACQ